MQKGHYVPKKGPGEQVPGKGSVARRGSWLLSDPRTLCVLRPGLA